MGLMTSMRNRMHVVLWGLLAMFLLSMTIGGLVGGANIIDQLLGRVNPNTTIARINGQDISPDKFQVLVNQELEQIRSSGQKINDFHIQRARTTAWDNLLQDILVTQEVDRLGITTTDEEVLYHLENNPPPFLQQNPDFQTDGVFDLGKYKKILSEPQGNEWTPVENFMKNTYIPNFKLQQYLDQNIIITERDLQKEFILRNINFTINAIHVTNTAIPLDLTNPSQTEMMNEYESSLEDFKKDEQRTIQFCFWKKEPSINDSNAVSITADKLAKQAKSGEEFSILANKYSQDPGNQGNKGGDLGWFKRGQMVKQFEDAAFNAKVGQIVGPVKSRFGYHIIQVRNKKLNEDGNQEVQASHILLKIEISGTTLADLKRKATLFSYDAQDFGFHNAADSHQVIVHTHEKLLESSYSIQKIGALRNLVQFTFRNELGTVSDIFENEQYFTVSYLDSIIPPGISAFKDVENQIKNRLKERKAKKKTLELSNELLIDITAGNKSLENLENIDPKINRINNETKTLAQGFSSINRSNYVIGALMAAKSGDLIGPLETNQGHALIEVIEITSFDSTEFQIQKESLKKNIFGRSQRQFFEAWLDNLKTKAEIVDNRKFYF